jgi:acyl phosphate:glycerol-3-phosphate acyltransferase
MIFVVLAFVVSLIISYLIGSIPTAYLVGRAFKGIDIRQVGSHNMGAMNIFYTVGFWPGMLVLVADIGKGMLALFFSFLIGAYLFRIPPELVIPLEMAAGVAVIAGHNFPFLLKFKGGKGGATAIGVLAYIVPWIVPIRIGETTFPLPAGDLIYLGSFLVILLITRWATFAYGISFIAFPLIAWYGMHDQGLMIYSICIILVPILMYIPRIKQILGKSGGNVGRAIFRKNIKDRM